MESYLRSTNIIDWEHPDVYALAQELAEGLDSPVAIAKRCFEWVRDQVAHSCDYRLNPVTCAASEVLRARTGFCYAKSHLLAALCRANDIPTGLCYQRLSNDDAGTTFCLHGLNAIFLPDHGWYRVDPRGNKPGITTEFVPPEERLAFSISLPGEANLRAIYPDPLPIIVTALQTFATYDALLDNLPDIEVIS